jgi:hypothetical protein
MVVALGWWIAFGGWRWVAISAILLGAVFAFVVIDRGRMLKTDFEKERSIATVPLDIWDVGKERCILVGVQSQVVSDMAGNTVKRRVADKMT